MPHPALAEASETASVASAGATAALLFLFLAGRTCLQFLLFLRRHRPAERRRVGTVSRLVIYPVKSCLGVPVTQARVSESGLVCGGVLDRSFAVVSTATGKCIGLKHCPRLALVQPVLDSEWPSGIRLTSPSDPDRPDCPVAIGWRASDVVNFDLFGQTVQGRACDAACSAWLRSVCARDDLQLVHCPAPQRPTLPELRECQRLGIASAAFPGELPPSGESRIAYANTAPLLLATEVALDAVNRRLADKGRRGVDWRNFRPNLVVSGPSVDRDEEAWTFLFIGDCVLAALSPCTRCGIVTVDYAAAGPVLRPDGEPLITLAEYRKDGAFRKFSPVFGVNGFVERTGDVRVGVEVLV